MRFIAMFITTVCVLFLTIERICLREIIDFKLLETVIKETE